MVNKKILTILLSIVAFILILLIILSVLGNKIRIGYLDNFNLKIDDTLLLNDITNDYILTNNIEFKKKFIYTNNTFTNYLYECKIYYYSKIFKNSDIYGVYPKNNIIKINDNNTINININDDGSPFFTVVSSKLLDGKKIDKIEYQLKIKNKLLKYLKSLILFITLLSIFYYISTSIYKNINNYNFENYEKFEIPYNNNNNQYLNIFIVSFIIVLFLILIVYQNIVLTYPFNYGWESQAFILDLFLSYNNKMPDTFLLPNITSNILYKYIFIPIGQFLNIFNMPTFNDLRNSLNPFFLYKEFVEYVYTVNIALLLISSIIIYFNIVNILKSTFKLLNKYLLYILSIFTAIFFIFQANTFTLIFYRPEPSGLLMFAIALFFTIKASKTNNYNYHKLYIILSGFFAGLAYLQKILLFGGVIILPIIYFIIKENDFEYKKQYIKKSFIIFLTLTIILIIFNIILYYFVINDKLVEVAFSITKRKDVSNPYFKILIIQLILPIICVCICIFLYLININKIKLPNKIKNYIYYFIIYITIVISSILITLLLPNGIQSLLNGYLFSLAPTSLFLFAHNVGNNQLFPIIITFILLLLLISIPIYKFDIFYKRKKIFFSIFLLLISILINLILSRGRLNIHYSGLGISNVDQLIGFSFITISIIVLVRELLLNIKSKTILIFTFSIIVSIYTYFCFKRIDFLFNKHTERSSYMYTIQEWFIWSYGLRGTEYAAIMKNIYNNEIKQNYAIRWSKNIKELKKVLLQINNDDDLSKTIIVTKDEYLNKEKSKKITNIDSMLEGNILVSLKNNGNNEIYLREDYNFYLISKNKYNKKDERIIEMKDLKFSINNLEYNIYLLTMKDWIQLHYNYNGEFIFDGKELEDSYMLIEEK